MAITWNIYNILLAVAIGIFSLGILYLGYAIATSGPKATTDERMIEALVQQSAPQVVPSSQVALPGSDGEGSDPFGPMGEESIAMSVGTGKVPQGEGKPRKKKTKRKSK